MWVKLPVSELRIGMYVEELDRPWLETPFLFQGLAVSSEEDLAQLRKYCQHVYVTAESAPEKPKDALGKDPKRQSVAGSLKGHLLMEVGDTRKTAEIINKVVYSTKAPVEREIHKASAIREDVNHAIDSLYDDIRGGRIVDSGYAKAVIGDLTDSVLRNGDAHMLLSQLKQRDLYAATHSMNVCSLALAFGRHLGLAREDLLDLGLGALLIDVGNIKIPKAILEKKGPLTEEEFAEIKRHPAYGVETLQETGAKFPPTAVEVVYTHHERYDGSGYPCGLAGEDIPLFGRMVAIVDVYDAVTSDRAYRSGHSPSQALNDLYNSRQGHLDPPLVEQFIQCLGIYPVGSVVQCSTGEIGIVIAQNPQRKLRPKLLLVLNPEQKPFPRPKTVDLSLFKSAGEMDVSKIVPADEYGIKIADYLGDLSWAPNSAA